MTHVLITRRSLCAAVAFALGGIFAGAQGAQAETWRFAHMWPEDSGWGQAVQKFADLVAQKTNGAYEVKVFPAGQLGNERENEESLKLGNLDFSFGGPGVLTNFDPTIGVFDMPFMFKDYDHANAVMDGAIGAEVFESLRKRAGIRVLASGAQGFRNVLTKNKAIKSIDDLKNVKIRTPEANTFIQAFRLLSANPVPVPWGDTYLAVQSGVVDGMEGTPDVMKNFKMYEVGKNVAITRHIMATLQLLVSEKVYQSLPADLQKAVNAAAQEAWGAQRKAAQKGNEESIVALEKEFGVTVTRPDLAPFRAAVQPFWAQWGKDSGASDIIAKIQSM